jgi:hypothetical protein
VDLNEGDISRLQAVEMELLQCIKRWTEGDRISNQALENI